MYVLNMAEMAETIVHPYYPQSLRFQQYAANEWSVSQLIGAFAAGWIVILGIASAITRRQNPNLRGSEQVLVLWFVLTGLIHCFFEGYFVYNHASMPARRDFFGQLWKEYALSDSRYMSADPLVLVMESWTVAIWGPLSLLTAVLITQDSAYRYPVQALVSTGHIYGNLLYFSTSLYEEYAAGTRYYRPEPFYFWVYFVAMNAVWFVVPGWCLYGSVTETARAVGMARRVVGILDASKHAATKKRL
ncbi:emopamil binding protein [Phlyctema vagabunda]|uniref:Emopamil binding protein n=1 Tax=Phlyctema vagabunda TaxID=108571 RepID=A0ABR4PYW2_9HELO